MLYDLLLISFCYLKLNFGFVIYWNFFFWGERNSLNKLINEKVMYYLKFGELGLVFIFNLGLKNWIKNKIIFIWNILCNGEIGNYGDINIYVLKLLD